MVPTGSNFYKFLLLTIFCVCGASAFVLSPSTPDKDHSDQLVWKDSDPVTSFNYEGATIQVYAVTADESSSSSHFDEEDRHHRRRRTLYQFTPAGLMDVNNVQHYFSAMFGQHFITVNFQMWNEAIQKAVADHLGRVLGHPVRSYQVQPIPLDQVMLAERRDLTHDLNDAERYQIFNSWVPYRESVHINLMCYSKEGCTQLANDLKTRPKHWAERFQLAFLVADSDHKSPTEKEIAVFTQETFLSSSKLIARVTSRFPKSNEVLMTSMDADRLLWNAAKAVIRRNLVDEVKRSSTAVVVDRESRTTVRNKLRSIVLTPVQANKLQDIDDPRWSTLYWEDPQTRPDTVARSLNERRQKLRELRGHHDHDGFSPSIFSSSSNDDEKQLLRQAIDETYETNKEWVSFDGERFIVKPLEVVRINLGAIREKRTWQQLLRIDVPYYPEVDLARPAAIAAPTAPVLVRPAVVLPAELDGVRRSTWTSPIVKKNSVISRLIDGETLIVRLKNARSGEYLYQAADNHAQDSNRRRVFTWRKISELPSDWAEWRLTGMWRLGIFRVRLIGTRFPGEYLYPSSDEFSFDKERRRVFTWRKETKPDDVHLWADGSADWLLDTYRIDTSRHPSRYAIFNLKRGEYLYASSDVNAYDNDRRRVFTWKGKENEAWTGLKNQWDIEIVRSE